MVAVFTQTQLRIPSKTSITKHKQMEIMDLSSTASVQQHPLLEDTLEADEVALIIEV